MKIMWEKLSPFGRFIRSARAARFYHDGGGAGMLWNWWHPLAWVLGPFMFLIYGLVEGFPEAWNYRYEVGFGMKPYFKKHPERLVWDA